MSLDRTEKSSLSFNDFASKSTLHGLNQTCNAETSIIKRIAWTLLLLSSVAVYIFFVATSVLKYYSYNTNTKITETSVKELEFPAVSICQQNQFSETLVQNNTLLRYWLEYLELNPLTSLTVEERENATNVLQTLTLWQAVTIPHPSFITKCKFEGKPFDCAEYFTIETTEIGMCVTFMRRDVRDRVGPLKTKTPGFSFGLDLWIDINTSDNYITSSSGNGVKVIVHDHNVYPRINEHSLSIEPGTEAYIAVRKRKENNLKPPYSKIDCVKRRNSGLVHPSSLKELSYTYEVCMGDCVFENILKSCSCDLYETTPSCTLADYYFCVRPNMTHLSKCDYLYPCKPTLYETRLTTLSLPTPMVLAANRQENGTYTTTEDIVKNMINLKVYYPSLKVKKVNQIASYTFDELISHIGGQLGLFLGASLLTMCEFLDYLCRICHQKCLSCKDKIKRIWKNQVNPV